MRTIPIALLNSNTRAKFMRITRADGQVFGFGGVDKSVVIEGVPYEKGFDLSSLESTAGLDVNNAEMSVLPDDDLVTSADLLTGVWDNFAYVIFEADWKNPADIDVLSAGTSGEVAMRDGKYVVEIRGLKQAYQQPVGQTVQKTCPARFADFPAPVPGVLCRLDPADWTISGTLTAVASRYSVTDVTRLEVDDWFGEGVFTATSGPNAGRQRKIKFFADGVFAFDRAFDYDFEVGDTYEALAGCRRRHERTAANPGGFSDCIDKFDNLLNFQGFPHVPGFDQVVANDV